MKRKRSIGLYQKAIDMIPGGVNSPVGLLKPLAFLRPLWIVPKVPGSGMWMAMNISITSGPGDR